MQVGLNRQVRLGVGWDVTTDAPMAGPHDQDALFRALFAQYFGRLARLARLLGADDAEDVAQEAFWWLHRRRDTLTDHLRAVRLLHTTVVRLSRQRAGRERFPLLAGLSRRQREVLVLRYGLDLATTEIAETLALSPRTVEAVRHRAMEKLRRRETPTRTPAGPPLRRVETVAALVVAALVVATSVFAAAHLPTAGTAGSQVADTYRAESTRSPSTSNTPTTDDSEGEPSAVTSPSTSGTGA
ncbi:sigma-70 family RNA polymerase sigma factor [Amycolatopsis sp. A133]|uniref:RNA polymerase sigma factor n=1 Tax=Amycolatopsis sp. A133 TaxID=3064472 RepID=UPI0027FBB5C4|nr:sigma-70 family RNA polymerase sigma factor [Amycolatopsis sp. A133]MDQ7810397.1 sigma-70 family RNA polymerase sigma factor [Amycolatopsis sp. A133]